MPVRPSSSPERGEALCSADDSEQDQFRPTPFSPLSSFFIIHESNSSVISPSGNTSSPPKLRRKGDESKIPGRKSSSGLRKKKLRSKTPSSAPFSSNTPATLRTLVDEHRNDENEDDPTHVQSEVQVGNDQPPTTKKRAMELSILNRCGSAPDLPMWSPLSASVYTSSKKRTLKGNTSGASPHLATLQRSRLTPLPVKKPDPLLDNVEEIDTRQRILTDELDSVPLQSKGPLLQEKMCQDAHTISFLKQRLVTLEREVSASTKYRYTTEKQIAQLSLENQRLQTEKLQQQASIDELDKAVLKQRHEYDKLSARYAAVYASLQKLVDQQGDASDNSAQQSALQALARENQNFLRKLRVLEARHAEDKTLTSNQDKKIKRLKAELEALRHLHEAKNREDDFDDSVSDTDQVSRLIKPKKRTESDSNHGGRPSSASSTVSITSSTPRRAGSSARVNLQASVLGTASHLVTAEAYQYIDPSILKVLEKVDSQFSITNAINLSVVLKKWLNSCVHIVCSTHLPTVLQTLLKRTCDLLHCEHAALFVVDHAARKLVASCSERGPERWELPLDKGTVGYAARRNMLCNVHCANDDPRFYSSTDSITGTPSREVLALPIVHELQLQLEAHVANGGDSNRGKTNNLGVFAVLRVWNTTHQKPFSANDQILGCLLAIQAGIILRQTAVTKTLQKINHKMHQILQMPSEIVAKASTSQHAVKSQNSESTPNRTPPSPTPSELPDTPSVSSLVQLVAVAQNELGECLGIKQLRIFILDTAANKLWHVGDELSHDSSDSSSPAVVRRYVSAQASLCALLLRSDATAMVLSEPSAEAAFNDTVDIPGGARGLYLVPILSPWGNGALPFGVMQVSRVAKARLSASPFALTASEGGGHGIIAGSVADIVVNNEREAAQQTEDRLMLELLGIFCRVFAGLLHHVAAQQLYDSCPPDILQAQLATLNERLSGLAESRREDEDEDEDGCDTMTPTTPFPEVDRTTSSRRTGRHASVATVLAMTPPQLDGRRVASADPKHRTGSESRRAASSPAKSSYSPTVDTSHQHALGAMENLEISDGVFPAPAASDGSTTDAALPNTVVDAKADDISANDDENRDAETIIPESEPNDPELFAPVQQEAVETATEPWPAGFDTTELYNPVDASAPLPEDWTTATVDGNGYEEQFAAEGQGYTWGDGGVYDPTLWPAEENADTYAEGEAWGYGVVDDGTLANEDEDGASRSRGSHISTNSAYAIDLHLSSRMSSADTDQPSGAL